MKLKQYINALIGELKFLGDSIDQDELDTYVQYALFHGDYNYKLNELLFNYAKEHGIALNKTKDGKEFVKGDFTKCNNTDVYKEICKKDKGVVPFILEALKNEIRDKHIENEDSELLDKVAGDFKHKCHDVYHHNNIDTIENYLDELHNASPNKLSKPVKDTFINTIRKEYVYSDEQLKKLQDKYKSKYEFGNLYDETKEEFKNAKISHNSTAEKYSTIELTKENQSKMVGYLKEADGIFQYFSPNMALGEIYTDKDQIERTFAGIANEDVDKLEKKLVRLEKRVSGHEKLEKFIDKLDKESKDDRYTAPVYMPENIPLRFMDKPQGLSKANGVYCALMLTRQLKISFYDFVNDPLKYIREYDKRFNAAYPSDAKVKDSLNHILPPSQMELKYRDIIYNGALNFVATFDNTNALTNISAAAGEELRKKERDKHPIIKTQNEAPNLYEGLEDLPDVDDIEEPKGFDEDNIEVYKNILVSKDDTKLSDIVVGKYYDSNEAVEKENKTNYFDTRIREFFAEAEKARSDKSYKIPEDKVVSINEVINNYNTLKEKIYNKYLVNTKNPLPEDIEKAKTELASLLSATIQVCKDVKVISTGIPSLEEQFRNNASANNIATDYYIHLAALPEGELMGTIMNENHLNYAKTIESDPTAIANDLEGEELEKTRIFEYKMNALLTQAERLNDDISSGNLTDEETMVRAKILSSLYRQLGEFQEEEIKRIGDAVNDGLAPKSYLDKRTAQIQAGEPLGTLNFGLSPEEKIAFGSEHYYHKRGFKNPAPFDSLAYVGQLGAYEYKPKLDLSGYNKELYGPKVNLTKEVKISEVVNEIRALEEKYNQNKDLMSPREKLEAQKEIYLRKNSLVLGYLGDATGGNLTNKINGLGDKNLSSKLLTETNLFRRQALVSKILDARAKAGEIELDLSALDNGELEAEAVRLGLNPLEIRLGYKFNNDVRFPKNLSDSIMEEFSKPKYQDMSIKVLNDLSDKEPMRVYTSKEYLEDISSTIAKNIRLQVDLDKNDEARLDVEEFINNLNDINLAATRYKGTYLNNSNSNVQAEFRAVDNYKVTLASEALERTKDADNPYNPEYKKATEEKFTMTNDSQKLLEVMVNNADVSLEDYARKKALLAKEIRDLKVLDVNLAKNLEENKTAYYQKIKSINNLYKEIKEYDQSLDRFIDATKKLNPNSSVYPTTDTTLGMSNFMKAEFLEDAKLKGFYNGMRKVIKLAKDNGMDPKELFGPNGGEKMNTLISKQIDKISDKYLPKDDEDLSNGISKLFKYNDKNVYKDSEEYRDYLELVDFMSYMDSKNLDKNIEKGLNAKNQLEVRVGRIIDKTNLLYNDSKETYYNLLFKNQNESFKKCVFNHDEDPLTGKSLYENFNAKENVFKSNDNQMITNLEANFQAIKRSLETYRMATNNNEVADCELKNLTKAYFKGLNDYFMAHPEKLNDRALKDQQKALASPKDKLKQIFRGTNVNVDEMVGEVNQIKANSDLPEKVRNASASVHMRIGDTAMRLNSLDAVRKLNPDDPLAKETYLKALDQEKVRLYERYKEGLVPKTFYTEMMQQLDGCENGYHFLNNRPYTEAEKNELKNNIHFGLKHRDEALPKKAYKEVERKNIVVDINRVSNPIEDEKEEKKEEKVSVKEVQNPNKKPIQIDLGEAKEKNAPKSQAINQNQKVKQLDEKNLNK